MSDFVPKPGSIKIGGLGRKAQKLQALKEKAEQLKTGAKPTTHNASPNSGVKANSNAPARKAAFNRKAV